MNDVHTVTNALLQLAGAFVLGHIGGWVNSWRKHVDAKTQAIKDPAVRAATGTVETVVGAAVAAAAPAIVNEVVKKLGPTLGPVAGQTLGTAIDAGLSPVTTTTTSTVTGP